MLAQRPGPSSDSICAEGDINGCVTGYTVVGGVATLIKKLNKSIDNDDGTHLNSKESYKNLTFFHFFLNHCRSNLSLTLLDLARDNPRRGWRDLAQN